MDKSEGHSMDDSMTFAEVEIPEGAQALRELRLIHYLTDEGVNGLAVGHLATSFDDSDEEGEFDLVAVLGMLRLAEASVLQGPA